MPTGQAIREELWRWGLIQLLGTNSGTQTAYITDTVRLKSDALSGSEFDDCYVRITGGAAAPDGEQVKVDYLDTANGYLYLTPVVSAALASGDTYEVWKAGVDPDDVDRARDEALTRLCSTWYMHPVSEIINAGYIEALASANWQVLLGTGSGAIAKQTVSFPYEFATDTLLCTNTDTANEGAESASLYVQPSQSFYLYVPVSVRSGTAQVIVRDVTNGANIDTSGTDTETLRGWSGIELTFTIPSGCGEITVRLIGQEATAIVEWGPVYLHRQNQKRIQIPSRVLSREHVGPVYCISDPPITGSLAFWGEEEIEEVMGVRRQQVGDAVLLRFEEGMYSNPYAYSERVFYSALSAGYQTSAQRLAGDDATTTCPIDYVVPAMVRVLAEQYMHKQPGQIDFWSNLRMEALRQLEPAERTYGPLPMPTQERARVISVPTVRV